MGMHGVMYLVFKEWVPIVARMNLHFVSLFIASLIFPPPPSPLPHTIHPLLVVGCTNVNKMSLIEHCTYSFKLNLHAVKLLFVGREWIAYSLY